ncbi:MAG: hypothetical protein UW58_C0055G0001, partial [Candidatus Collierbacteria bacterium GW2011_GWC2_44_30]
EKIKWRRADLIKQARKFSRENFEKKFKKIIDKMEVDEK